jgi:L-threonylcarbamoyladenylate synthase
VGLESTVVSIIDGKLTLLRPGMIMLDDIKSAVSVHEGVAHPSPGMHERHYSPRTKLILVKGVDDLPNRLGAFLWRKKPGLTARCVHMPAKAAAYANRLYDVLHEVDREGWPWIAVELPPDKPEWSAIRDRLQRAAGGG